MASGNTISGLSDLADRLARRVIDEGSKVLADNLRGMMDVPACTTGDGLRNKIHNGIRVALMLVVPSVVHAQQPNSENPKDNDGEPKNGTVLDASVGLSPMDDNTNAAGSGKSCLSPGPEGEVQVTGTCIFTAPGPEGNRFKFEFQGAEALMDTDLNVQLRVGGVREIAGTDTPPPITVCGTDHCVTSQSSDVGWVLREDENHVVVLSEQGETLVKTTFNENVNLTKGKWVRIDLQIPQVNGPPKSTACAIRWAKGDPKDSAYLLAAMASLLTLTVIRKRQRLKKEKGTVKDR